MLEVLAFVLSLIDQAQQAPESNYRTAYINACEDVREFIDDYLWREGDAEPEYR